jgi:peptidylprolyl isomerase
VRRLLVIVAAAVCAAPLIVPAAGAAVPALDAVTITGLPGEKPTVTFAPPLRVKTSISQVRVQGAGTKATKGSQLLLDYVILNGRTGEEIETSFGSNPVTLVLDKTAQPALLEGLVGTTPGSRVLVAIAPKDGLAASGASVGLRRTDTVLFVIDVRAVDQLLERATGTSVPPPPGLPKVELARSGKPKITMPKSDAPADLIVQPLIRGDGPEVRPGQTVRVHYTGALWDSGKVFDSSWARGQPAQFPIGTGSVIAGWDEGIVGQTVGSQVLLVIPPAKGYGESGNPQAGIKGTDTLVFVVDILAAS